MENTTPEFTLSAAECAAETGLSVKALRLYERHGLITPYRTFKNWRVYGAREIERLNEVIILKGFGLSLARIAELLAGKETNLESVLSAQTETLTRQRDRIDRSIETIEKLRAELTGGEASVATLVQLAKEMTMTQAASDQTAWKVYEQARPRTEIVIDAIFLTKYCGFYRLNDGIIVTVELRENCIQISLTGQPFIPMVPEAADKFFCRHMPLQVSFERDVSDTILQLTLHQSGHEINAQRISPDDAAKSIEMLAERISREMPFPTSEAILRQLIEDALRGIFDETRLTPELGQAVRNQFPLMASEFEKIGNLLSLDFKGVGQDGWDGYDAVFTNGKQEWRIYMQDSCIVSGLLFRPRP